MRSFDCKLDESVKFNEIWQLSQKPLCLNHGMDQFFARDWGSLGWLMSWLLEIERVADIQSQTGMNVHKNTKLNPSSFFFIGGEAKVL